MPDRRLVPSRGLFAFVLLLSLILAAAIPVATAVPVAAAASDAPLTLSLDPSPLSMTVGETRQVNLQVTNAANLGAFETRISFDPYYVQVADVRLTDFMASTGRTIFPVPPIIDNVEGFIRFGAGTIGSAPGVSGGGILAQIEVVAFASGTGAFNLHDSLVSDISGKSVAVVEVDGSYQIEDEKVDDIPPEVQWTKPTSNGQRYDVNGEVVDLQVAAADNYAVDRVEFWRWDHPTQQRISLYKDFNSPYETKLDTSVFTNDWNEVYVLAYDAAGNMTSEYVWLYYKPAQGNAPPPPQGFSASDGTLIAEVVLTWTDSEGATYYEVYRSDPDQIDWEYFKAANGQGGYTNDGQNTDGTVLAYAVKACNESGCSAYSNADTGFADMPKLNEIANADKNGTYLVSWVPATTASRHELQESRNGGNWRQVYSGTATSINITDSDQGDWCYRLRGYNGIQEYSPWTEPKCTTVDSVDPRSNATDIIAYGLGNKPDSIWYGENGAFPYFERFNNYSANASYDALVPGDFNGDGLTDVVAYGEGSRADALWYGVAGRSAPHRITRADFTITGSFDMLIPGDFNGDGRTDILAYGYGTRFDSIWYGLAGNQWPYFTRRHDFDATGQFDMLIPGDFNGDGRTDILAYGRGAKADNIWYGLAGAQPPYFRRQPDFSITSNFDILIPGDFNGDGRTDILAYGYGARWDSLWYGLASGRSPYFTRRHDFSATGEFAILAPGDFNGDGRTDIVAYGYGSKHDSLWYGLPGTQAPYFERHHDFSATGEFDELVPGDFNGDGRADILAYGDGPRADRLWFGQAAVKAPYFDNRGGFSSDGYFDVLVSGEFDGR